MRQPTSHGNNLQACTSLSRRSPGRRRMDSSPILFLLFPVLAANLTAPLLLAPLPLLSLCLCPPLGGDRVLEGCRHRRGGLGPTPYLVQDPRACPGFKFASSLFCACQKSVTWQASSSGVSVLSCFVAPTEAAVSSVRSHDAFPCFAASAPPPTSAPLISGYGIICSPKTLSGTQIGLVMAPLDPPKVSMEISKSLV